MMVPTFVIFHCCKHAFMLVLFFFFFPSFTCGGGLHGMPHLLLFSRHFFFLNLFNLISLFHTKKKKYFKVVSTKTHTTMATE